jgi:DNA-binding transcriptional ArsR family regulator
MQRIFANILCIMIDVQRLDGGSLKVLAHPLRVRIVGSLRHDGPATATLLGERLGESSGLTSYHVRVLAENGFVEEVPDRRHGRERWWRAAHQMTSWRPQDFGDDPDELAAEQWLTGFTARRGMEWLDGWLHRRPEADPAWVAASEASDYMLRLTPDELQALVDELNAVVLRHLDQHDEADRPDQSDRPDPGAPTGDRQPVRLLLYAFPDG